MSQYLHNLGFSRSHIEKRGHSTFQVKQRDPCIERMANIFAMRCFKDANWE